MAHNLSVKDVVDKNRVDSSNPWLILLEVRVKEPFTQSVVEVLRVCRNNEDITFGGYLWTAYPFEVDIKYGAGQQPEVQVDIVDLTRAVQSRLQAYKGIVGSEVDLMVISAEDLTQPAEIREYFVITGANAKDYTVSFTLGAENALSLPFPRRKQSRDRCGWRYKSAECGYVGTRTTCDQSLDGPNGCRIHNNTLNFGGFPGINPSARFM